MTQILRFFLIVFLFLQLSQCFIGEQNFNINRLKNNQQQLLGNQAGIQEYWFQNQILDHYNLYNNKSIKQWSQRYFIFDKFYDQQKGPLFLYICGEAECYGTSEGGDYPSVLAKKFNGIVVSLEHRFYGKSQPFGYGKDTLKTENLKYLTHEQALEDLALFLKYLKNNQIAGIQQSTPVIVIGGSYAGALTAWFRYKYSHLTIGAIASSAVVNSIKDFQDYDMQIGVTTENYGEYCTQGLKNFIKYLEYQLKESKQSNYNIKKQFNALILNDDQFLQMVSDNYMGSIQYGNAKFLCEKIFKRTTIQQQLIFFSYLLNGRAIIYTNKYLENPGYDQQMNLRQWNYQLCTNLGWFQTPYQEDPIRPQQLNLDYFLKQCKEIYGMNFKGPNVDLTNQMMGGLDIKNKNIIISNGSEDPWQWASVTESEGNVKTIYYECEGCGHCQDMRAPLKEDPIQLKEARLKIELHIKKWLKELQFI